MSILSRGLLQEVRDPLTLFLTLFTTPFFIFFYWLIVSYEQPIQVGIDLPKQKLGLLDPRFSTLLEEKLAQLEKKNTSVFKIINLDKAKLNNQIDKQRTPEIFLTFKEDVTDLHSKKLLMEIQFDSKKEKEQMIALTLKSLLSDLVLETSNLKINLKDKQIKPKVHISAFDMFVPSFLVFSIIMIVFSTSMVLTSEIESGVFMRYRISHTPAFQFLLGIGSLQFMNSAVSIAFAILLTYVLGFDFHGKILEVFFVCLLGSMSAIGIGMFIASILSKTNQAFLTSSFVMFLLLLLSGIIFPKPELVFEIGNSYRFDLLTFLPTAQLKFVLDSLIFQNKTLIENFENLNYLLMSSFTLLGIGTYIFRNLFLKGGRN